VSASPARAARPGWAGPLAPFAVRSFRFQWPADILVSWAFEMENLILGWYILTETQSVLYLTFFGSLQFLGTLLAPFSGVIADRLGRRTMLCALRATLAVLASCIMTLALIGALTPALVFPFVFLTGLVRPSDLVMRNSLIGDTMPPASLMGALGLSRTTMDTARIVGALAGAALFATVGIGAAYIFVASFYVLSFSLTLGVSRVHPKGAPEAPAGRAPPATLLGARWRELIDGLAYVWHTPAVLGLMWLAFLVNFTAFPLSHSLLPYVAKVVYGIDATGLSHLVASFACGALIGSLIMTATGSGRSARFMVVNLVLWYAILAVWGWVESKAAGMPLLFVMGIVHSLAMVTMSGVLLRVTAERFRARVMGVRMLAVYGLPVGLLITGPLIERFGFAAAASLYVALGLLFTTLIAWRWRASLWR
jgi:predicted MFS family arabinose efflux permease